MLFLYRLSSHFVCSSKQVKSALPALARLIHSNDEEVLTDACWALSYLSDGTNDKIQAVIEAGVCPRLVEFLMWVVVYLYGVLWLFSEFFFFNFIVHQSSHAPFFRHPSPSVLMPALRTVGNIVTGDDMQTQVWNPLKDNLCCLDCYKLKRSFMFS